MLYFRYPAELAKPLSGTRFPSCWAVSSLFMHLFPEANFASPGNPDRKVCLTLHVPAAQLVEAPKLQPARRKALEDAYAEAADRWG